MSRRTRPTPTRPWAAFALLLPLGGGCHLFEGFVIDCVAGQPCARTPQETGGETGDSAPPVPTSGWIVSIVNAEDAAVYAFDADGEELKSWTGLAAAFGYPEKLGAWAGAVAYNRATGAGVVTLNGAWATLESRDGGVTFGSTYSGDVEITDVEYADDGYYWFAVHDNVYAYDIPHAVTHLVFVSNLEEATGIGLGEATVYTSDWGDGHPDVYAMAVNHTALDTLVTDVRGSPDLTKNLFAGPEDEPYGCTPNGLIYDTLRLADGSNTNPVVALDQELSDITDCGWDPGDGSWLLFSVSTGVWRVGIDGTATNVAEIPRSHRGLRANFFR